MRRECSTLTATRWRALDTPLPLPRLDPGLAIGYTLAFLGGRLQHGRLQQTSFQQGQAQGRRSA